MKKNKDIKHMWNMIKIYSSYALTPSELKSGSEKNPNFLKKYGDNHNIKIIGNDNQGIIYNRHFGWSVPTEQAVNEIIIFVKNDSILEIGSGMGLWAHILQLYGVVVYPTDDFSHGIHQWGYVFTNVEHLNNIDALKKYNDVNVLMLIWPEIADTAHETLKMFKGSKLIFIGELQEYSANASPEFYFLVKKEWEIYKRIEIPRFFAMYDYCFLLIRK